MTTWRIIAIAVGMLLAGCTTVHLAGGSQLPSNAQIVGGGLSIEWSAPGPGTAILVETVSGKIVKSASLGKGDAFSFNPLDAENIELLNSMFGGPQAKDSQILLPLPKHTQFILYFIPERGSQP